MEWIWLKLKVARLQLPIPFQESGALLFLFWNSQNHKNNQHQVRHNSSDPQITDEHDNAI